MINPNIKLPYLPIPQREAVKVAILAADILPSEGKAFVLDHILSEIKISSLKGLPRDARREILKELTMLEDKRQNFIDDYAIKTFESHPHRVSVTLPKGASCADFIVKANELSRDLYGLTAVQTVERFGFMSWYSRALTTLSERPSVQTTWLAVPGITEPLKEASTITIDGLVSNSMNLTREQQGAHGWCNVETSDLVAACSAFFIATRRDLFDGMLVRGRDITLALLSSEGIVPIPHDNGVARPNVAAACLIEKK